MVFPSATSRLIRPSVPAQTRWIGRPSALRASIVACRLTNPATITRSASFEARIARVPLVVVITTAGGVSKRLFHFGEPVDAGLAQWASDYLNEAVAGLQLGTGLLRQRFEDPGLLVRFSETPGVVQRGPSMCGEHSRDLLVELGYADGEIDAFVAAGAVLDAPVVRQPRGHEPSRLQRTERAPT